MADNQQTLRDPQGSFEDWIELHNLSDSDADLSGEYFSDDAQKPTKWRFPDNTRIPANGYLLIWADEDGTAGSGLHASFKLAVSGEQILLIDSDVNNNALLDSVTFGPQEADRSYGRSPNDPTQWTSLSPTPGAANALR